MKLLGGVAVGAASAAWAVPHFRSPAVRSWTHPTARGEKNGALYARSAGAGDRATILLHGLLSTGDVFGAPYDRLAATRRVVVPDLLGFGRSMETGKDSFSVEDHLDALDQLAERLGLFDLRWTIGAHSMGSAFALRWAGRHLDNVERVVCWGAPVYRSPEAAQAKISGSTMTRLFVLDTRWAERVCAMSCRHRIVAGWLTALCEPSLPVPIARGASLHTWPAYRDAMRHLVIETDWAGLLAELDFAGTSVELVWGTEDKVGDPAYARTLLGEGTNSAVTLLPGVGHHLPMTHPQICLRQLDRDRDL